MNRYRTTSGSEATILQVNIDPALLIAAAALAISWNQLRIARTDQGGSGMDLVSTPKVKPVPDEVWQGDTWPIWQDPNDYVMTVIKVRAKGPFAYFDLQPCVWSANGHNSSEDDSMVYKLSAEDGPVLLHLVLPKSVMSDCHIGVIWWEAHGRGLRPMGLRVHCGERGPEKDLRVWRWASSPVQRLLPERFAGRWAKNKGRMVTVDPRNPQL